MSCAENDTQEFDERYQAGQKQQVAATAEESQAEPAQIGNHCLEQQIWPQDADIGGARTTQDVNTVEIAENTVLPQEESSRQGGGGTPSSKANSKTVNETGPRNHVAVDSEVVCATADDNGAVNLGDERTSKEAEEESRRRKRNFTMRDPQESHHRTVAPLGEVESGDDSDCIVAATERRVEPLKINLARDREPIRTIIKLTPGAGSVVDHHGQPLSPTIRELPGSPKITIRPPKPPPAMEGSSSSSSAAMIGGTNQNSNNVLSPTATATMAVSNSSSSSSSSSIPKLTIKPVINPADDLLTVEVPAEQMQIIPKLLIKGSSLDATSQGRDGLMEPHIVPKLTIRGVNNHNHHLHHHHHHQQHYQHHPFAQVQSESPHYSTNSAASASQHDGSGSGTNALAREAGASPTSPVTPLVPKLTIKMDNHHPHHHIQQPQQQQNNLRVRDVADAGGGGSGGSGSRVESPIPKLHIKAILPEGGLTTQSPPSAVGTIGTNATMQQSSSGSGNHFAATGGSPPVLLTSSEGVKLTIKPLPEPPKLPKLTIKTTGLGTVAETSDASLVSSTSCSFSPKLLPPVAMMAGGGSSLELQHQQMQMLHAAQHQPASPSDQHSNISSSSIPKLTIKPFPPKVVAGVGQAQTAAGAGPSQATGGGARGGTSTVDPPQIVPKLTIKPIPPPSKQSTGGGEDSNSSSETSINSLESSPVSSSSSSSLAASAVLTTTTSPSTLRMTIKVPPQQQDHSSPAVATGSAGSAGVPTASLSSGASGTVVTKLNIKPILPPPSPATGGNAGDKKSYVDGLDVKGANSISHDGGDSTPPSEGEVDPSALIVIPKVTIKTLANPRSQATEILSTPKVTLKPIPKPTVAALTLESLAGGSGGGGYSFEKHSPQAIGGALTINSVGHQAPMNSQSSPTMGANAVDGSAPLDSPRIILKINKGSSSTTTTSSEQHSSEGMGTEGGFPMPSGAGSILANELKRPATATLGANSSSVKTFSSSSSASSSSSSSLSSTSSTTSVSVSTTSSSAGSDPASPSSSAGGGDQGDPGSPEAKKSKLETVGMRAVPQPQFNHLQSAHSEHNAVLRQSLLQNHHHQQLQFKHQKAAALAHEPQAGGESGSSSARRSTVVSDVIVIDDDSKSENESMRDRERGSKTGTQTARGAMLDAGGHPGRATDGSRQQPFFGLMSSEAVTMVKQRRSRGTPRGSGGGRQSRRGAGGGRGGAAKQQLHTVVTQAPRLIPPMLNHDDREEGSSSDCMIVDDPASAGPTSTSTVTSTAASSIRAGGLSLENLLLGSTKASLTSNSLYNVAPAGGRGEVEKNGTASNSSVGSIASSIGALPAPAAGTRPSTTNTTTPSSTTPGGGVRMSTRRGAGQLLKEVLANKHHDRDSGVDEAKTDGEGGGGAGLLRSGSAAATGAGGPTPSKRPRGRPKKLSGGDLSVETNGGGSSSSMEGHSTMDSMIMALAMMGGAEPPAFMRPDGPEMLGAQEFMQGIGIMTVPGTPVRTPRTRGRGRGRGRGKLSLPDGSISAQSPQTGPAYDAATRNFALPPGAASSEGNGDPLFIDAASSFNLLFNHVQTPRGGGSARSRRGRRGSRTPRGGGRGAARAAMVATLLDSSSPPNRVGPEGSPMLGVSPETNEKAIIDPLLSSTAPLPAEGGSPPVVAATPTRGKGRARAPRGTGAAANSKRRVTPGTRTPRGKKAQEAAALLAAAGALSPTIANAAGADPAAAVDVNNSTIFMTPMAGGLDLNRPKLQVRELKTPRNAIKSNTPPSRSGATPVAGGTPEPTTPAGMLQVFEEDTRMSGDFTFTTPVRLLSSADGCLQQNEESQSSYLSSASVTQDATTTTVSAASANDGGPQPSPLLLEEGGEEEDGSGVAPSATDATTAEEAQQKEAPAGVASASNSSSSSSNRKPKGKMEVLDAHRAAFTVDLLAEYEWPPPTPGTRGTDTFMIQEQIAEYLGVKSFKRKYPDLMRRPVDMEERNFILEQGLASEKMCDLGLTAVYASEILDIMCTDYPEKYEEYTRYTREKHFRELSNRQRQQQEALSAVAAAAVVPAVDRAQLQKEKAIESAASWNCSFNRERRDTRRACMDLQTYVVHVPKRLQASRSEAAAQPAAAAKPEERCNYPVALVPGQFSEYYSSFTPEELACYPINTILLDPMQLQEIVASERYRKLVVVEESRLRATRGASCSSSSSSSSSGSGSDSSDGSSDESSDGDDSDSSSSGSSTSSAGSDSDERDPASDAQKELDRRKRAAAGGEQKHEESDSKASTSVSVGGGPVRRSSRGLSAGAVVIPTVVEIKELTDSDDSDVPLIAHAAKRKSNLLAAASGSAVTPSAGGGKRMQEETPSPVERPPLNPFMCAVCLGPENKNKHHQPERFVRCNRCRRKAHPSCIGMSSVMYRRVQQYKWQCSECKLCMKCNRCPAAVDSKMVYCDQCDRGYHLACKGLRNLPDGRWHCSICTICGQCGARTPEGHPNPQLSAQQRQHLAMVAEWTHEYGLNELTKIREHVRTLCVPCVRHRRQRLQHPDQTPQQQQQQQQADVVVPAPALVLTGRDSDKMAILNNNNNNHPADHPRVQPAQQPGAAGTAVAAFGTPGGVRMQPMVALKAQSSHFMMNSTSTTTTPNKQHPHTVTVRTNSTGAVPVSGSHRPPPTGAAIAGGSGVLRGAMAAGELRR